MQNTAEDVHMHTVSSFIFHPLCQQKAAECGGEYSALCYILNYRTFAPSAVRSDAGKELSTPPFLSVPPHVAKGSFVSYGDTQLN